MNLLALPIGTILGAVFIGGEMISCLLMSLILIYSLKSICISLPLKLVLILAGELPVMYGAIVSFAPPVIPPLFAQPIAKAAINNIYRRILFFSILYSLTAQNNNYIHCKRNVFRKCCMPGAHLMCVGNCNDAHPCSRYL